MKKMLAPSILSADFKNLGEQIRETEKGGAQYIHFDIMDGMFVPSIFLWNAGAFFHKKSDRTDN